VITLAVQVVTNNRDDVLARFVTCPHQDIRAAVVVAEMASSVAVRADTPAARGTEE
jgi:hypothetical protein